MLRTPVDAARQSPHWIDLPIDNELILRSFRDSDFADVRRLYHEGVLADSVNPPDHATDPDYLKKRYLSTPQGHFWVAEASNRVVATIGLTVEGNAVGHVSRLRCEPAWVKWRDGELVRLLVARAADHARNHDLIKLVIHTPVNDERAVALLHQLGFEFARVRDASGRHLLEFYLNIYEIPAASVAGLSHPA